MAQVLGIIDLIWNGTTLDVEKGATVMLGGFQQKEVVTESDVHYARENVASEIEATVVLQRGQKLSDIYLAGAYELQANCDTGQSFVWPGAFLSNRPKVTAGEGGKVQLQWRAGTYQELLNG